jgi:predicted small secreted protein
MYLKIRPPRRTRGSATLALVLALLCALVAGCNTASNTGNGPAGANSSNAPVSVPANTPANVPQPATNTPPAANTSSSAGTPAGPSPTDAVRGYYEAGLRKDTAGAKRFMSRATLQLLEDLAKREGKTPDEMLTEAAEREAQKPPPTFGNERITGDTAYVDIQSPGEPLRTMRLVKEGGEWKLDFGKPKTGPVSR